MGAACPTLSSPALPPAYLFFVLPHPSLLTPLACAYHHPMTDRPFSTSPTKFYILRKRRRKSLLWEDMPCGLPLPFLSHLSVFLPTVLCPFAFSTPPAVYYFIHTVWWPVLSWHITCLSSMPFTCCTLVCFETSWLGHGWQWWWTVCDVSVPFTYHVVKQNRQWVQPSLLALLCHYCLAFCMAFAGQGQLAGGTDMKPPHPALPFHSLTV